jgi:hypothetical protein
MIDREYILLKHNEEVMLDESGYHRTCLSVGDWHRLDVEDEDVQKWLLSGWISFWVYRFEESVNSWR